MALTAEQRKLIDGAVASVKVEAVRTDPIDRDVCSAAFSAAYAARGLQAPHMEFGSSPWDVLQHVESMANQDNYRDILGEEVILLYVLEEHDALMDRAENHRLTSSVSDRTDKFADPLNDLGNVCYRTLMESSTKPWSQSMLDCGNNSFWQFALSLSRFTGEAALGILEPPPELTFGVRALLTCNFVHCFEGHCFVSERPEAIHHPAFKTQGPSDHIIVRWRDGFVCQQELWY